MISASIKPAPGHLKTRQLTLAGFLSAGGSPGRNKKTIKKRVGAALLAALFLALPAAGAPAATLEEIKARGVFRWGADAEGGARGEK